jgi:hypothetical protein
VLSFCTEYGTSSKGGMHRLECSKSFKRDAVLDSFHIIVASYNLLKEVILNNNSDAFNRIVLANSYFT